MRMRGSQALVAAEVARRAAGAEAQPARLDDLQARREATDRPHDRLEGAGAAGGVVVEQGDGGAQLLGLPAALAADWLTSTWDQNAAANLTAPAEAVVEDVCGERLKGLLGLPQASSFAFVTGCQMAHTTALAAARLIRRLGGHCDTALFVFDIEGMGGRERLAGGGITAEVLRTVPRIAPEGEGA